MKECPNCHNICDSKFCPECGADLTNIPDIEADNNVNDSTGNSYDVIGSNATEAPAKSKKPIGCIIVLLIIIAALAGGGFYYTKIFKIEAVKNELVSWASEMADIVDDDNNDSEINSCEELINLTNHVWGDALKVSANQALNDIWDGYDYEITYNEETQEYVEGASDFNEALERLYSTDEVKAFNKRLTELYRNATAQKIPDGIPDIKDAYTDLLIKYSALVEWCTWPNASYNTYMEESQKKYDAFWEALNKFVIVVQQ